LLRWLLVMRASVVPLQTIGFSEFVDYFSILHIQPSPLAID
jgi:hypothetical protein